MKDTSKQSGRTLILLSVLAIFANGVFAQSNTGSISGIVQDQGGAIIRGATITVTNVGTNETRATQSNDEGYYEVPSLPTGVYKVVGAAGGFQESTVSDARLAVGAKLRVDLKMPVGGVTASVTVADKTPTETETSTVGDTITLERVGNAPINGRDFTGLLETVPGSVQTTNQFQTIVNGIPSPFGA